MRFSSTLANFYISFFLCVVVSGIDLDNVYLWRQFFVSILPTLVVLLRATVEGNLFLLESVFICFLYWYMFWFVALVQFVFNFMCWLCKER